MASEAHEHRATDHAMAATMSLDYVKSISRPAPNVLFGADEISDDAVYTVSLILL